MQGALGEMKHLPLIVAIAVVQFRIGLQSMGLLDAGARKSLAEAEAILSAPAPGKPASRRPSGRTIVLANGCRLPSSYFKIEHGRAYIVTKSGGEVPVDYRKLCVDDIMLLCCVDTPLGSCCKPVGVSQSGLTVVVMPSWRGSLKEANHRFVPWSRLPKSMKFKFGWQEALR